MTLRTLRTVAHSLMVHSTVPEAYVNFALMYTIDHIFPVLPIKNLINKDRDLTTPHKLATGTKTSVSHLRVFIFFMSTCAVALRTTHGQNNTRKCDTVYFVPVASLCDVVGSPSSFIRSLIGRTEKI